MDEGRRAPGGSGERDRARLPLLETDLARRHPSPDTPSRTTIGGRSRETDASNFGGPRCSRSCAAASRWPRRLVARDRLGQKVLADRRAWSRARRAARRTARPQMLGTVARARQAAAPRARPSRGRPPSCRHERAVPPRDSRPRRPARAPRPGSR
jgi:hypothetical protein